MKRAPIFARACVLLVWAVLAGGAGVSLCPAQQPPESRAEPQEGTRPDVAFLDAAVREAKALLEKGDQAGARAVCQRALARADLANASDEWLAAAADGLWKLGSPAYGAGDLRSAHDAWAAVHRHRARTLPDDHPDLQDARQNLAVTKRVLGDLPGALALEEQVLAVYSRTLPDDHPDLQDARQNLANTKRALGDLPGALALQEQVLTVRSRTLPDDHPDLQAARHNLAVTKGVLGDLPGALALEEQVFAVRSRTLPDDHPHLQKARQNLAVTKRELGDLPGALALEEQVFAVRSRTLPDDHPDLQDARQNLAVTKRVLGDLPGANALFEQVLAVRSRTLPDDHPDLQAARHNLAVTKKALGDLPGALALGEQVFAVRSRTLPDDHPDLQATRQNLAATKKALGDLPGALALEEQVYAVRSRTLPDDHPDLQAARLNLANTKRALGDLPGALALEEQVFAVFLRMLPDDHPDLQAARQNLAVTKKALGDLPGALALNEQVFAVLSRTLPDDHPDLQDARQNLAVTKQALGDLPGALALNEQAFAVLSRTLPNDHPNLQAVRNNLAATKQALGDLPAAAQLNRSAVAGALARLAAARVSTRDIAELAVAATKPLSHVGSVLDASATATAANALPTELGSTLARDALALLTATRSAQTQTTELLRQARSAAPAALDQLLLAINTASKAVDDAIALPPEGRVDSEGRRVSRNDAIRDATLAKDAAERALLDTVPKELRTLPTAEALAAGLAQDEAAVAFLTYTRWTNDTEQSWITTSEQRFAAFVLTPTGTATWHSLAPVADIEPLIANIRKDAHAGMRIATRSTTDTLDALPGRDPEAPTTATDTLTKHLTALSDQLLAPVLAALPKDTKRLVISPADEMLLAPIEDLPLADGRNFGEAFDVRTMPSLGDLVRTPKDRAAEPSAFVVGGIDYDGEPAKPAPIVPDAATPILDPIASTPSPDAASPDTTRSDDTTKAARFQALPGAAAEVNKLANVYRAVFPDQAPTVLQAVDASEAAFVEQAPGKTFLHLATHGYFAPESVWGATGARDEGALARFDVGREDRTAQMSPFSLTGIALAGANLPPDPLGRREGILTAQEIARLDLTACHLATLSACNTSLGVRRGGTGLASLRQAFHAAGVRFVLATLWEVNDANAEALMTDFYTRIWKHGEEPRSALRAAKRAARERGVPFRDWAGWMITGR